MRSLFKSLVLTILLAGCQSTPEKQAEPAGLDISAAPRGKTFTEWGEYVMDSNDLLSISVDTKAEWSGSHKISPSGYITVPVAGSVRARGLTEAQLRESLVLKFRPHIKLPKINVSVTQMNSYVVAFEGRVQKPGTYKLESRMTLQQGLALAGGVKGELKGRVTIVRDTPEGVRKRFETNLANPKGGQAVFDNLHLERGDLVIVE